MTGHQQTAIPKLRLAEPVSAPPQLQLAPVPGRRGPLTRTFAIFCLVAGVGVVAALAMSSVGSGSTAEVEPLHVAVRSPPPHRHHRSRPLPSAVPSLRAMSSASTYLQSRLGTTAFAVVDSRGREFGLNQHETFVSASVTKAMLLVAYLRALAAQKGSVGSLSQSLLYPMIHVSDNRAATAVYRRVGDTGLEKVARLAGMREFGFGRDWANESISAADQARFFYRMDDLIPGQFRAYAHELLAGVDPAESWGIPLAARPAWRVYFKGGWRRTGEGQLVSQIARLERPGHKLAIAVMTVTDPSMAYGEETIAGVVERLLATGDGGAEHH